MDERETNSRARTRRTRALEKKTSGEEHSAHTNTIGRPLGCPVGGHGADGGQICGQMKIRCAGAAGAPVDGIRTMRDL